MMKKQLTSALSLSAAAVILGLSAGCATTQEVKALQEQLDQVRATAEQANSTAEQASSEASAASATASEAQASAAAAQGMAEEGLACCTATNEKLDRLYNRLQQK